MLVATDLIKVKYMRYVLNGHLKENRNKMGTDKTRTKLTGVLKQKRHCKAFGCMSGILVETLQSGQKNRQSL